MRRNKASLMSISGIIKLIQLEDFAGLLMFP